MSDTNWEIRGVRAHYFKGSISAEKVPRTLANLLREVADWVDENELKDDHFECFRAQGSFEDEDGTPYITATLYYREAEI